jgi:hypothetical protein
MSKVKILNAQGNPLEVGFEASIYREAHDSNCTVAQFLERKYGAETDSAKHGTVLEQVAASTGIFLRGDKQFGLRAPTCWQILEGNPQPDSAGVIVRDASPASRIVFPAVILEMLENQLVKDYNTQAPIFEKMIAVKDTIAGNRFEQPVVTFTKPEGARSQGQTQGALPSVMGVISVADVARKIPTFSLGLEITDEALKATTLDFVSLSLARQAAAERDTRVEGYITAMVAGDADLGMAALTNINTTDATLDPAAAAGTITQKAWVKWLYRNIRKRRIDWIICTISTALKIEARTGKPIVTNDDPNSPRIDALQHLVNPAIGNVNMFIVDSTVVADDVIIGLDSRYAIRRVRNSEAEYTAVEEFVLKKTKAMRFDFGEIVYRLYDEAWDKLTIV